MANQAYWNAFFAQFSGLLLLCMLYIYQFYHYLAILNNSQDMN